MQLLILSLFLQTLQFLVRYRVILQIKVWVILQMKLHPTLTINGYLSRHYA